MNNGRYGAMFKPPIGGGSASIMSSNPSPIQGPIQRQYTTEGTLSPGTNATSIGGNTGFMFGDSPQSFGREVTPSLLQQPSQPMQASPSQPTQVPQGQAEMISQFQSDANNYGLSRTATPPQGGGQPWYKTEGAKTGATVASSALNVIGQQLSNLQRQNQMAYEAERAQWLNNYGYKPDEAERAQRLNNYGYKPDQTVMSDEFAYITADTMQAPEAGMYLKGMPSMEEAAKGTAVTSAVTGAGAGAAAGAAFGVPGAIVGGVVGGLGGLITGFMSEDKAREADKAARDAAIEQYFRDLEAWRQKRKAISERVKSERRRKSQEDYKAEQQKKEATRESRAIRGRQALHNNIESAFTGGRYARMARGGR